MFRITYGLDLPTVQFTGAGPSIQSTVGGHTPVAFSALPSAAAQIKDGLLRALAVTAEKRSPTLPDTPTMAESGFPGQEAYTLTGVLAPAGTPKEIVSQLHQEIVRIVALPDVRQRLDDLGFEIVANSPDEFAARIKTEMEKWGKVIHDAKLKVEGAH
jgi:tripartite-type tricarboxylate transporter receptor subunit TctC